MKLAIHQPNFIPRLKVLQKLSECDTWAVLDDVQYAKREWQNRARLIELTSPHRQIWLTIPVHLGKGQKTKIRDVRALHPETTSAKFRTTLTHLYRASPYWQDVKSYWDELESAFESNKLVDIATRSTEIALRRYSKLPKVLYSHKIAVGGRKSLLMANICGELGANYYIADSGAYNYLKTRDFQNITVVWQEWTEPTGSTGSVRSWRNLSFVCFLAMYGPDRLRRHLQGGNFTEA